MNVPVTAVICNFNKAQDVVRAVASLKRASGVAMSVIVVDNASTDGSALALREAFGSTIELIELPENIGGSGGFAAGMEAALRHDAPYVMLLDNDAHVPEETPLRLAEYLAANSGCAVVAPTILVDGRDDLVQELGGSVTPECSFTGNFRNAARHDLPTTPLACDYVPACCLMVRRSVLADVGPFDTEYFLYWDDIAWCQRIVRRGLGSVMALPGVVAWHRGGGATNPVARYYQWRNCLRFLAQTTPADEWPRVTAALTKRAMTALLCTRLSGKHAMTDAILAAFEDARDGHWGKCTRPEVLSPPPAVPVPHDPPEHVVRVSHVLEAIDAPRDAATVVVDAFGNRVEGLAAIDVAQSSAFAVRAAALVSAAVAGARA